jgi:hypothetical protein
MIPDTLENLSKQLRGRVKACEHFNPNVGESAHHQMVARLRGYRVTARLGESRVELEVRNFDTRVSFSLNTPDRVCLLNRQLDASPAGLPCPVFLAAADTRATTAWLQAPENARVLSEFRLTPQESLQVYRNAVILIGEIERATEKTIARLCDLADCVRDRGDDRVIDGLPFAVEKLPPALRPLAPLIRRFAIGDDAIRGDLTGEASAAEQMRVCAQVEPLLPQINAYLDSFGSQPLSNEAMLLGRLAEAVAELGSREA